MDQAQHIGNTERSEVSALTLHDNGPIVQVTLSMIQAASDKGNQESLSSSPVITGPALISTEARVSRINPRVANLLKLPVLDIVEALPNHGNPDPNTLSAGIEIYAVHLAIVGMAFAQNIQPVFGSLQESPLMMVIGRDVLQECAFLYNGKYGEFTLFS